MKQSFYLALTIGPIYKTLALAKRTRELWAASYLFSYLMEKIVDKFDSDRQFEIILPVKTDRTTVVKIGAGLYPDRLIVKKKVSKSEEKSMKIFVGFKEHINQVRKEFIEEIKKILEISDDTFLENYLQTYTLQIILPENEDPIKSIFPLLDSLEQQPAFNSIYSENSLKKFLENKKLWTSFLYNAAFPEKFRFPSVLEISASGLKNAPYNNTKLESPALFNSIFEKFHKPILEDESKSIIAELKRNFDDDAKNENKPSKPGQQFRHYHKYMAVIQADGDDMGILLRALFEYGRKEAIQSFSGFLIEFGYNASQMIKDDYDGVPVYLGGDDMLFFAPIKNSNKNIFMLIDQLDRLFKESLSENALVFEAITGWNKGMEWDKKRKKVGLPTISYGVAISYHKYPLKEAIETARGLLFETSKHIPGKNAISFRLLKNSGHAIGASFNKDSRTWEAFNEIMNDDKLIDAFLSSIQYNLEPLRPILKRVLTGRRIDYATASYHDLSIKFLPDEGTREYLLKNLSDNFYNEGGILGDSREFVKTVLALLLQTYREMEDRFGNQPDTADRAIDTVYACLRMMQFLYQPDNKEDEE